MLIRFLTTIFLSLTFASLATAHHDTNHGEEAAQATIGPVIDAPAPAFSGVSMSGDAISLENVAGAQGTIIVFVRSADWCPFCKRQLIELSGVASGFADKGWETVGISYDSPEKLENFSGSSNISFPLVSDTNSSTIKAFGLLNEEVNPESRSFGIPHPAVVFIDSTGVVKAVLREEGYRTRPSVESISAIVEKLSATD